MFDLDFTARKKKYLSIKLADERVVNLGIPRKSLYTKLIKTQDMINEANDIAELYDEIAALTSAILSENRERITITAEEVEKMMDIEDMSLIIFSYQNYAADVIKNPNS